MQEPIPAAELSAMRARCEKATAGPWTVSPSCVSGGGYSIDEIPEGWYRDSTFDRREDADFIAHARTDLPRLLEAYEAALAEIARLECNRSKGVR